MGTYTVKRGNMTEDGNYRVYSDTFEYDSDGFLIHSSLIDCSDHNYEIADCNTFKTSVVGHEEVDSLDSQPIIYTITYQFFETTANTIGFENRGMSWMGKQNKNLAAAGIMIYNHSSLEPRELIYTYQYDSKKRVIKQTHGSSFTTYTYY